jgi:pyrroloquinoline quinone biosynthesis protein B
MHAIVLGAAAGGGFPQWNSNAAACQRARRGDPRAKPRTQASLAVSSDGRSWFLLNAAPDLRAQIEATEALWPKEGLRSSPLAGVVLTGGDVDAIAGLLHLRERHAFTVYATQEVQAILCANPIFNVLAADCVARRTVPLDTPTALALPDGRDSGLTVELFAVPGKVPLYLEATGFDPTPQETGDTVGARIADERSGAQLFFIPGCARMVPALARRLEGAPLVFFDGTLCRDDEMIRAGLGPKTGKRMGHMSMDGEDGVIAAFRDLGVRRKVFIHINNSNPVLLDDSAERAAAQAAGWEVAHDGMEIAL